MLPLSTRRVQDVLLTYSTSKEMLVSPICHDMLRDFPLAPPLKYRATQLDTL